MVEEASEIIDEGNNRRRIEQLEEEAESLRDRVETLELLDFQKQLDRLNERLTALGDTLMYTRRFLARTALAAQGNAMTAWCNRVTDHDDIDSNNINDCISYLGRRLARAKGIIDNSNRPEQEYSEFRAEVAEYFGRFGFKPLIQD